MLNIIIGLALGGLGYLVLLKANVINNQFMPFTLGPRDIHGTIGYKLVGIVLMLLAMFVVTGILDLGSQFEQPDNSGQVQSSSSTPFLPPEDSNGIVR